MKKAVVCAHLCLDVIPQWGVAACGTSPMPGPGELRVVGPAVFSTGGVVSNTGLTLHRLGVPVKLVSKIGGDQFGKVTLDLLRSIDPELANHMIVAPHEGGSYSLVLNPPGEDRRFLHYPGPNDTFSSEDVDMGSCADCALFHFGYPPLMKAMLVNHAQGTADLLGRAKAAGMTTSLDMAMPDPQGPSGRVDWTTILQNIMPHTDLFLPSWEEILFMMDRGRYDTRSESALESAPPDVLRSMADRLIAWGVGIVVIKLGEAGVYIRVTEDAARLKAMGAAAPSDSWRDKELMVPSFVVNVRGTTGAGDATIAGFLAAFLRGEPPLTTATMAVAVGAHAIEGLDSLSGVRDYESTRARIERGWQQREAVSLGGRGSG